MELALALCKQHITLISVHMTNNHCYQRAALSIFGPLDVVSTSAGQQCFCMIVILHVMHLSATASHANRWEIDLEKSTALRGSFVIIERGVLDIGRHAVLQDGSALLRGAICHECALGDTSWHVAAWSSPHLVPAHLRSRGEDHHR